MKTLFFSVFSLFFLVSCSSDTEIKVKVQQVLDHQVEAWNRGDIPEFMKDYYKSPETVYTSGGEITKGFKNIEARYMENYGENLGTLHFDNLEITPLGSDAAVVLGFYHLKMNENSSDGVFTLIFKKTPEGIKIIHDHTSAIQQ